MDTLKKINKEIEDFKSREIQIVPGLGFNQYDILQKIFFYYNSKFVSGDTDEEGDRKYFLNIVKNPCKVFTKAIDFDTKNIRLLTEGGGDSLKTWFMERDLKYWMKDKQFGKVLNRIFKELPIFGSVVLKIVDGTPYFVDLRNFIVQQSADTLESSNFIIEVHNLTPGEFRKIGKKMQWKQSDIDKVIDEFHKMKNTSHIKLLERYGEMEEDGSWKYRRIFFADVGIDEYDAARGINISHKGVELESKEWTGNPYWEFHAEKVAGRWLGLGVVETLIEPQVRINEIANLQAKSSYWVALRVWQTRDSGINRNLMTDVRNGEILNVESEISPVDTSDRNLSYYDFETTKWFKNRDEMSFAYDAIQGDRAPASTPLGETKINVAQTLSYFEGIQENVALDIKEMIYEVIIPQFEKDASPEHTLRLVGKDLEQYTQMVKNEMVLKEMIRFIESSDTFPTPEDRDTIALAAEELIKKDKEFLLTVPKNFYKDSKYNIDIDITGESVDTRVRYATKFALLQAATADPTLMSPEEKKNLVRSMSEDGGINPNDIFSIEPTKKMEDMVPTPAGGGVSAPALNNSVPGQTGQTV